MDNLLYTRYSKNSLQFNQLLKSCYEHATKTILLLDTSSQLSFITFSPQTLATTLRKKTEPIQQLQGQNIVLLEYLVDLQAALILTQNGAIMTISEGGIVDIKAQNDDGISGGSLSPTQEYIYVVTKNNTLIQLDTEFDLVKEVPLDDHETEKVDSYDPRFSWKADGSFFAINIMTDKGRKCHTRDHMLGIFRSPSKSDVQPEGVVQSVSQKSRINMTSLVSWQPSAGIIAGADYINKAGKKINRIIFWEKNGLRHLEFELPNLVTDVLNLTWSPDSLVLCVQVLLINSQRWLYLYHRSNYHWYLKNTIALQNEQTQYLFIKNKRNQIIKVNKSEIEVYEYILQVSENMWKSQKQQMENSSMLQASVDGTLLRITDFSLGVIPPPMSHHNAQFQSNLHGIALYGQHILVLTQKNLWLCQWIDKNLNERKKIQIPADLESFIQAPVNFKLIQVQNQTLFSYKSEVYQINIEHKMVLTEKESQLRTHYYSIKEEQKQVTAQIKQGTLIINDVTYYEHCTSFIFYHQFLIFTVSTSGMYDKMFVIDLVLDQLNNVKQNIKIRLDQIETKKLLNYRAIQRGSKIVSCSKNRVIFQLPRGNLQTIYPKVITIKYVNKCLERKQFKEAFETIRTHKLDLNILYDINPQTFTEHADEILLGVKRTDYLNLFVSQLRDGVSSELQYCKTQQEIEEIETYIEVKLTGKKVKQVCEIVSKTLRKCDKEKYILSIFTSEIKMGLLDEVLFEIKDMRKNDIQEVIPPHLLGDNENKKKKNLGSQQILEYVCWLVDANAIYEASLLTYDLQLASMTARCTQMDPKQYIPYLQQLKSISDPIQLRRKICMDLKKYENAVQQLSKGNEQQIRTSIELIKKHKLFKCGLKAYCNTPKQLKQVKMIVIEELLATGESNEAYKLALSISAFDKALEIATNLTDGKKIKEVIDCYNDKSKQEKQQAVLSIIAKIGEQGFKNKNDLAKLKGYVGLYDEAAKLYIQAGNYQKAYKYYVRASQQFKQSFQFKNGMALVYSLQKNQLIKDKSQFIEKITRLHKLHKQKSVSGPTLNIRNLQNDDMYSEVSNSSKAASQYTISTTTGLRKKRDKKRSILSRNVKEGSPLEEQYLVAFLVDLQNRVEATIKQTKLLIQHLIYVNMIGQAESLRNVCKQYAEVASKSNPKFYAQVKFESDHPEYLQLLQVYENKGIIQKDKGKQRRDKYSIESFSYMF